MAIFNCTTREKKTYPVELFCLGLLALLVLLGCNNSLNYQDTNLDEVNMDSLFVRAYLVEDGNYEPGYDSGLIRSDQIYLRWYKCSDRDFLSYKLFRDEQLIKTFVDADSSTFIDNDLTHDTYYNYKLICTLRNGMATRDTLCLKTPRFLPPSDLYYILAYPVYPGPYTAILNWTSNAESGWGSTIEKNRVGTELIETLGGGSSTFFDDEIELGVPYRYRIKSFNNYEETEFTEWQEFTFFCQASAPTFDSLQQVFPGTDVRLQWTDNSTVNTEFQIQRTLTSPWEWETIATLGCNDTEWIDTSEKAIGSTYVYEVVAVARNSDGSSWWAFSNSLTITITDSP
jgi:hypothetical protein